jgi:hypothetical protein
LSNATFCESLKSKENRKMHFIILNATNIPKVQTWLGYQKGQPPKKFTKSLQLAMSLKLNGTFILEDLFIP